ncbi:MAG: cytochrome b [Alphaproteobacteria bacterium]
MPARDTDARYGNVAAGLHWLIAAAVIFNLWLGLYLGELPRSDPNRLWWIQIHKSNGLSILVLSVTRVLWRAVNPMPGLVAGTPTWERVAARAVHYTFYVLIIAIPLSGWAMVSSSPLGIPTIWFGLFEWPHLPFLAELPRVRKQLIIGDIRETHKWLAYLAIALITLHVAAALKHHFWDRDTTLLRMLPWTRIPR